MTSEDFKRPIEGDLIYVDPKSPGYKRKRWGRGFAYFDAGDDLIEDDDLRERFESLAIPPAWTDVWICTDYRGHIQATGRDDKDRKQYIYHDKWEEHQNLKKFNRLLHFGKNLPELRASLRKYRRKKKLSKKKVLALVIILLEKTLIRIGNEEYQKVNNSYGLTTLRQHHLDIEKTQLHFEFNGKSGKEHEIILSDSLLASMIRRLQELPGQKLFQYVDDDGSIRDITSADVNEFLQQETGYEFTAKDFRTWHGTVLAIEIIQELIADNEFTSQDEIIKKTIDRVSEALGNTPAICRDYYIHPVIFEKYKEDELSGLLNREFKALPHLTDAEIKAINLLEMEIKQSSSG